MSKREVPELAMIDVLVKHAIANEKTLEEMVKLNERLLTVGLPSEDQTRIRRGIAEMKQAVEQSRAQRELTARHLAELKK